MTVHCQGRHNERRAVLCHTKRRPQQPDASSWSMSPDAASHTRAVVSPEPVTMLALSGENAV